MNQFFQKIRDLVLKLYRKFGEIIRYGISGLIIAAINFGGFELLKLTGLAYSAANLIAIVFSKCCGYLLNKNFVYKSKTNSLPELLKEMFRFVLARGFTGVVDYFGVILLVEGARISSTAAKLCMQVVVITLNYVLGKFAVFKKKKLS